VIAPSTHTVDIVMRVAIVIGVLGVLGALRRTVLILVLATVLAVASFLATIGVHAWHALGF
jgi:multisubunit Na+/H+ antiporter MnhF subunit